MKRMGLLVGGTVLVVGGATAVVALGWSTAQPSARPDDASVAATAASEGQQRRRSSGGGDTLPMLQGTELEAARRVAAELMASTPPTPEQMIPFLGSWEGTALHEGGVPEELFVTFGVQEGSVVGQTTVRMPRQVGSAKTPAFIRIADDGESLEWGFPNEQEGGGIEVYQVSGGPSGELTGTKELRGLEIALPAGLALPIMEVSLRRRPTP